MNSEYIVIVGRPPEQCGPLSRALDADGWGVRICESPARTRCPLLSGKDCAMRDSAAAAIVYLDPRKKPAASMPLTRCAAASASPAVVVLEGQVDPLRVEGGFAIVGSLRAPEVIAAAVQASLGDLPDELAKR